MAMVKMNVFHWHMTDSQSFPLVLKSHPDLSSIGAYSPDKVYTIQDIVDVSAEWPNFYQLGNRRMLNFYFRSICLSILAV